MLRALLAGLALVASCTDPPAAGPPADSPADVAARRDMVARQLRARDITDARVLDAMQSVPRHRFVPDAQRAAAYHDGALPIGRGQTISQPYIVALMTQLLRLDGSERVLEIGTGSGYQAAVLARLAREVYSIEIDPVLAERARATLAAVGADSVHVRAGDGYFGWPEAAPFDAVIITAAAPRLPEALRAQIREGGRIVAPLERGDGEELAVGIRRGDTIEWSRHGSVRFVPMTGEVRRTPAP
ncbi:MAG: protein-L-isoaspartate(D-aspartate) O-methyltransferase [Deltaproteobacteria bacterium]|nr:protein-L-isoaspartate(D-aspartate) O-methyltransferase [Deltaproteobacteria bacterium]